MTGLVVQSSILGVAGTSVPIAAAAASSLALGIFRDTRKADEDAKNLHAPNGRKRNHNGRPSQITKNIIIKNKNARRLPPRKAAPATTNEATSENALIQLYQSWMKLPQIFRFGVAGNLANLGFFFLEKVIFRFLSYLIVTAEVLSEIVLDGIEKYQDGMSFFFAYVIQIVTGHLLYAFLVYGMDTINTYEKYSKTLSGQFKVYGVGLFGATFLNSFLINSRGFDKTIAFWTTTAIFAVFNYFLVSWVVQRAVESSSPPKDASGEIGTKTLKRR